MVKENKKNTRDEIKVRLDRDVYQRVCELGHYKQRFSDIVADIIEEAEKYRRQSLT